MIVLAFTGQDGTGKSTQLALLREALEARGMSVGVVHQYGPTTWIGGRILPWAKRIANRSMRAPHDIENAARPGRREAGPLRCLASAVSLTLGWGRSLRNRLAHRAVDVLILDRCFVDEIIRARHKFACGRRLGSFILRYCVSRPALALAFTLDAATGWQRKKTRELTLDEYRRKVELTGETLLIAGQLWNLVLIPVDGLSRSEAFERVWGYVERHVATIR